MDAVSVQVDPVRKGHLWLRFQVDALLQDLTLPAPTESLRQDGLWRTTCFELFVRRQDAGQDYLEFNFSPSSRWAAYHFDSYRAGMVDQMLLEEPDIGLDAGGSHFALEVNVPLPDGWASGTMAVALSAVIEDIDGAKSYWALKHPPGKPDFHHADCFALTLAAPASP